ncbi:hypothetical protein M5K25_028292 [Dendrobium thyrsiflorum]|uniref:Uncharacterized protein n=1 Tax=Dendrobium thyrsiflorum TaxID=117978 RepID=A0ABD0TTM7_DENTH
MLSGKLIFSFKNGLNLSLDQGRLADGSIMKFGLGFEHLDMTSDGLTLTTVDNRALADKKPVLEFNVSSEYEFPTLKRKAVETSAAAKTVTRPANMKSVTTSFPPAQPEGVKPDGRISAAPSVYEVGSSSATVPLTRAQRKNRSKRLKKILEELDEQRKLVKAGLEDLGDASWLPETSPLLGGSRFHPLSAARGEENVRKIARSPPPAFQDEAESSKKRRSPFAGARSVIQRMADKERTTKSEIMRRMGRAVSDKVKAHILRKPTNDRGATRPPRREVKRYADLSTTYARADQHERPIQRRNDGRSEKTITARVEQPRKEWAPVQSVPRRHRTARRPPSPIQVPPSDVPSKIQKRTGELYRPVQQHPEGRTSSPSNRGSKSRNTSRPVKGKVVQPKEPVTVVTKEEPSTSKVQKQKERVEDAQVQPTQEVGRVTDPRTPVNDDTEMKDCEQYVPVSPNHVSGRSVDEILEELKASIRQIEEDEATEAERWKATELEVLEEIQREKDQQTGSVAEIFMVDTRGSLRRDQHTVDSQDVVAGESAPPDFTQQLLEQLRKKDERIYRMESRIEEMITAMTTLKGQSSIPQKPPVDADKPEVIHITDKKSATMEEEVQRSPNKSENSTERS